MKSNNEEGGQVMGQYLVKSNNRPPGLGAGSTTKTEVVEATSFEEAIEEAGNHTEPAVTGGKVNVEVYELATNDGGEVIKHEQVNE